MAICSVGLRYYWHFPQSNEEQKIFVGRHGLLHQVSWRRAFGKYQGRGCKEVCLEKYCHTIRGPSYPYLKQWPLVWQQIFQVILLWSWDYEQVLHPNLSPRKWTSRSYKQSHNEWTQERLDDMKGKWVEELSHILWMYKTTPHRSIGETPFQWLMKPRLSFL